MEKSCGKTEGSTSLKTSFMNLGLGELVEEFFSGIAHDTNMSKLVDFFEEHHKLLDHMKDNDYF